MGYKRYPINFKQCIELRINNSDSYYLSKYVKTNNNKKNIFGTIPYTLRNCIRKSESASTEIFNSINNIFESHYYNQLTTIFNHQ